MKSLKQHISESFNINESISVGDKFNHDGLTYKVIKPGKTQSKCEVVTKSKAGETEMIDNKIITKDSINEGKTKKISFTPDYPGIGGDAKELAKTYKFKVDKYTDDEVIVSGDEEAVNDFIEDYDLEHNETFEIL
jgi:hypothetical protein